MLDTKHTNIEVYRKAIEVFEDIKGFDQADWGRRLPAVIATILYQLLDEKERSEEHETV